MKVRTALLMASSIGLAYLLSWLFGQEPHETVAWLTLGFVCAAIGESDG